MEKASIKFTFLTLFLIATAIAVVPVRKVEARELQQTLRIVPAVLEDDAKEPWQTLSTPVAETKAKEPQQTLSMPVAETEAKELQQLPLSVQPNRPCLFCISDKDCKIWPWKYCSKRCCHI